MPDVRLLFFDAGGGHRSAAVALRTVLRRQKPAWNVELLDLQELLAPLDVLYRGTGVSLQDMYNLLLAHGWTLGSPHLLRVTQAFFRFQHAAGVRLLAAHWSRTRPNLVVSLVPNLNRAIGDSLQRALPATPFVTVLTDLADYPPHFWIERQPQYFICGTDEAARQALSMGHESGRILRTSGMILDPAFYDLAPCRRSIEREDLGLKADVPTGLVLFGGHGSGEIRTVAHRLDESSLDLQLILLCGHNDALAAELRARKWRIPVHVEGFTRRVPHFMQVSDFFIGKPGPGSVSEALAMGLPVIVSRNAWTLPQERFNAHWILRQDVGLVVRTFRDICAAVERLLAPTHYERIRGNVQRIRNRAVFEIPDLLEYVLEAGATAFDTPSPTRPAEYWPTRSTPVSAR